MSTALLAGTLLLALASVVSSAMVIWQRRMPAVHRRCLVTLVSDERHAFSGVLWQARGPWLVLRDAAMTDGQTRTPMDGEVIIHRQNVAFVQIPNGGEQLR